MDLPPLPAQGLATWKAILKPWVKKMNDQATATAQVSADALKTGALLLWRQQMLKRSKSNNYQSEAATQIEMRHVPTNEFQSRLTRPTLLRPGNCQHSRSLFESHD
jgi:hypothetical protein